MKFHRDSNQVILLKIRDVLDVCPRHQLPQNFINYLHRENLPSINNKFNRREQITISRIITMAYYSYLNLEK